MILVIGGTVAAVLLLIDVSLTFYYKEKLGFVVNQCALYAATKPQGSLEVNTFCTELMKSVGLDSSKCKVKTEVIYLNRSPASKVTIENEFPLFQSQSSLPVTIKLSDTATAVRLLDAIPQVPQELLQQLQRQQSQINNQLPIQGLDQIPSF